MKHFLHLVWLGIKVQDSWLMRSVAALCIVCLLVGAWFGPAVWVLVVLGLAVHEAWQVRHRPLPQAGQLWVDVLPGIAMLMLVDKVEKGRVYFTWQPPDYVLASELFQANPPTGLLAPRELGILSFLRLHEPAPTYQSP